MNNIFKSIAHNIGVVIVGLVLAYIASLLDRLVGIGRLGSVVFPAVGIQLLVIGFLIRVWATYCFYVRQMKVIKLKAQSSLVTSGPYAYSRNPLYLGGNVFIFYGAALVFGSTIGLILTTLHLPLMNRIVRREERQLSRKFGPAWTSYKNKVRRWV